MGSRKWARAYDSVETMRRETRQRYLRMVIIPSAIMHLMRKSSLTRAINQAWTATHDHPFAEHRPLLSGPLGPPDDSPDDPLYQPELLPPLLISLFTSFSFLDPDILHPVPSQSCQSGKIS